MSSPFSNLSYTIKKRSDGEIIATGVTNAQGEYTVNLPPGDYVVGITQPAGHTLDNNTINVPGQPPLECDAVNVDDVLVLEEDVTVVEASITTVTSEFLIN